MAEITIWADLTCPWSYVAALRLHSVRDHLDVDVQFDLRAWSRDLAAGAAVPAEQSASDVAVLAQVERRAFSSLNGLAFPTSSTLAFEAQKWGFALGQDVGERFDLALRRGLFLHGHDLSDRMQLIEIAKSEGLDASGLMRALDDGRNRAAVSTDVATGLESGVEGTPRIDLPDGSHFVNPGMTTTRIRGIAIIEADHPLVYEDILRAAASAD